MPKYNFIIKDRKKYLKTSWTLWNCTRDISVDSITISESSNYKASITGKTANDGNTTAVEFSVPLKHLSNFWKILNIPLIHCEVSLTLNWSSICLITDETVRDADSNANPPPSKTRAPTFEETDAKLYVPVVILSSEDDNKRLEQLKIGF